MKQVLIILFTLVLDLSALSLDEIIFHALENNPSLSALQERILANQQTINASDQFSNPELLILTNTIDAKEPMRQESITFKQELPYFGKRDAARQVALAQEGVLGEDLHGAKVKLIYAIRTQVYKIWEMQQVYQIICDYEDLTLQNIALYESYTMTSDNQHMGIMSAELALSDLRIQKSLLLSQITSAYATLSYLSAQEVSDLKIELSMGEMPGMSGMQKALDKNPDLALKNKEIKMEDARMQSLQKEVYPDISLVAGYSHRENFADFATFGLSVTLPVYGTEGYRQEEVRRLKLSKESLKEDTKSAISAEFQNAYAQMKSAYETYHIINDQALPQVEHMFELINASISAGGDLFKYIDIVVQKLKLEQKSIEAVARYNQATAKIKALSGEIR
jgi:outer membrane protein TolC